MDDLNKQAFLPLYQAETDGKLACRVCGPRHSGVLFRFAELSLTGLINVNTSEPHTEVQNICFCLCRGWSGVLAQQEL